MLIAGRESLLALAECSFRASVDGNSERLNMLGRINPAVQHDGFGGPQVNRLTGSSPILGGLHHHYVRV
jgi:hypothetical protein